MLENDIKYYIVASRGRDPDNPSNRTVGCPTVQRLELNKSGCSNTITSVAKDNWVLEVYGSREIFQTSN